MLFQKMKCLPKWNEYGVRSAIVLLGTSGKTLSQGLLMELTRIDMTVGLMPA